MRSLYMILMVGLVGCSMTPKPSTGWEITSKNTDQAFCFHKKGGAVQWNGCHNFYGDERLDCQTHTLLTNDGEVFSTQTKVAVQQHFVNNESKVEIQEGSHKGQIYFCPTSHVMKFN